MNITAVKTDTANVLVTAKIENADIEKNMTKTAKQLAKTRSVDGFRKGKVPVSIIKKIYSKELQQEAENDAVQEILQKTNMELDIESGDIVGEPIFQKYEKNANDIDVEITFSLRPTIIVEGYDKLAPSYDEPTVEEIEVQDRINKLLDSNSPYRNLKKERALANGDQANIDFVGKINGVEFEGGKAKGFELVIGSGEFIHGFEEQMVGMNIGETKDIIVTFPTNYQSEDIAGKEATFTITLNGIKVKKKVKLDTDMIKRLMPNNKNATVNTLKEQIISQIKSEKIAKLYNSELKPKFVEALMENYDFDLPKSVVEQEIDAQINQKAQTMTKDEVYEYKNNNEKLMELRESVREDAITSVKVTFLVDAIAKKENIVVTDEEVIQTIYHEAVINKQDPEKLKNYYRENNFLPAIQMSIIEDKLFSKIIGIYE